MARKGLHPVSPAFEGEAVASLESLYRTARRLTREQADAEDLVQETFLKAFRAADRFEPGTNLRAWLFTILHNTARNRARDRARDTVSVDSEAVDRAADAPPPGGASAGGAGKPGSLLISGAAGAEPPGARAGPGDGFLPGGRVTGGGQIL